MENSSISIVNSRIITKRTTIPFQKLRSELVGDYFETEDNVHNAVEVSMKNLDENVYEYKISRLILKLKTFFKLHVTYVRKK